jgi:hypothetical protein
MVNSLFNLEVEYTDLGLFGFLDLYLSYILCPVAIKEIILLIRSVVSSLFINEGPQQVTSLFSSQLLSNEFLI